MVFAFDGVCWVSHRRHRVLGMFISLIRMDLRLVLLIGLMDITAHMCDVHSSGNGALSSYLLEVVLDLFFVEDHCLSGDGHGMFTWLVTHLANVSGKGVLSECIFHAEENCSIGSIGSEEGCCLEAQRY